MAATPSLSEKNFYLATQNIVQAYQSNSLFRDQFKNSLRLKLANPADRTLDHLLGSRPIESYLWLLGRLSNEPKYFRLLRYTRPDQIDQTIRDIDRLFIEFSANKADREALERLVNGDSSFLTEAEKQSIAQAEGVQDEARLEAYQDLQNKHEAEGLYSNQNNQPALPNIQQFNAGSSQRGVRIVQKAPEPPKQEDRRVEMVRRHRIQQKAKEIRQSGEITRQPVRSEPAATAPIQRVREPRPLRTPFTRRPGGRTFEAAPRRVSTLAQRAQGIRASGALRAAAPALTRTGIGVQNLTRVAGPRAVSGFFGGLGRGLLGFTGLNGLTGARVPGGGFGLRSLAGGGGRAVGGLGRGAGAVIQTAGKIPPWVWLLLLMLLIFMFLFSSAQQECGKEGTIELNKSGPAEVENGKQIDYQILVNFKGSCVADVTVTDQVPANTKFIKADSSYKILGGFDTLNVGSEGKLSGNTVTWELKAMTTGQTATLTLSVQPTTEDVWVVNEAGYNAKFQGGTQGGTTGGRGGSSPPEGAQEQDKQLQAVVGGQGRNVAIIGDENAFTSQVIANGAKLGLNATKESYIRMIYQAAQKWNINPLIILGTWGTETGFRPDLADKAFSCPVRVSSSFEAQVDCSARIYNKWMSKFEAENKNGVLPIEAVGNRKGAVCEYNDPLIYAMDWYGPICHASDNNVNYRPNMLKYYKAILGS